MLGCPGGTPLRSLVPELFSAHTKSTRSFQKVPTGRSARDSTSGTLRGNAARTPLAYIERFFAENVSNGRKEFSAFFRLGSPLPNGSFPQRPKRLTEKTLVDAVARGTVRKMPTERRFGLSRIFGLASQDSFRWASDPAGVGGILGKTFLNKCAERLLRVGDFFGPFLVRNKTAGLLMSQNLRFRTSFEGAEGSC